MQHKQFQHHHVHVIFELHLPCFNLAYLLAEWDNSNPSDPKVSEI